MLRNGSFLTFERRFVVVQIGYARAYNFDVSDVKHQKTIITNSIPGLLISPKTAHILIVNEHLLNFILASVYF